jgi:hypothetical protein
MSGRVLCEDSFPRRAADQLYFAVRHLLQNACHFILVMR